MGRLATRGHPAALRLVSRAIASGRPPHALLLAGAEGAGKTTLALDLAAGLLCLADDVDDRPCRECAACRKVEHGNHPDLHRLSPEGAGGQIKIGQVQGLASDLALLPLEGRFRIGVIEKAHRLNEDAQNALLKTLEEPPAAVVLVLAADDSTSLLPTVVSRCTRVLLGPVAPEVITELVSEAGLADAARATALARLVAGRPGAALALAANADAVLAQGRVARLLLSLMDVDRRGRLAASVDLLEDGAALAAATGGRADAGEAKPSRGRGGGRASPAERRAAVAAVLAVWRDVARDVAVASRGGRRELRQHELLDELIAAGSATEGAAVARFLARIDVVGRAIDAYANPELALDALLLEWPAGRRAA